MLHAPRATHARAQHSRAAPPSPAASPCRAAGIVPARAAAPALTFDAGSSLKLATNNRIAEDHARTSHALTHRNAAMMKRTPAVMGSPPCRAFPGNATRWPTSGQMTVCVSAK